MSSPEQHAHHASVPASTSVPAPGSVDVAAVAADPHIGPTLLEQLARGDEGRRAETVQELQRRVGNHAVLRWVSAGAPPTLLRRGDGEGGSEGAGPSESPNDGSGGGGSERAPAPPADAKDGVEFALPDWTIVDRRSRRASWAAPVSSVELFRRDVPLPVVGVPVRIVVRGEAAADADVGVGIGPGRMRDNVATVRDGTVRGQGTLVAPADAVAGMHLSASLSGSVEPPVSDPRFRAAGAVDGSLVGTGRAETEARPVEALAQFVIGPDLLPTVSVDGELSASFTLLFDLSAMVSAMLEFSTTEPESSTPAAPGVPQLPRPPTAGPALPGLPSSHPDRNEGEPPIPLPDLPLPGTAPPGAGGGSVRKVWSKRWQLRSWQREWTVRTAVHVRVGGGQGDVQIDAGQPQLLPAEALVEMLKQGEQPDEPAPTADAGAPSGDATQAPDPAVALTAQEAQESAEGADRALYEGERAGLQKTSSPSDAERREALAFRDALRPMRDRANRIDDRFVAALHIAADSDLETSRLGLSELRMVAADAGGVRAELEAVDPPGAEKPLHSGVEASRRRTERAVRLAVDALEDEVAWAEDTIREVTPNPELAEYADDLRTYLHHLEPHEPKLEELRNDYDDAAEEYEDVDEEDAAEATDAFVTLEQRARAAEHDVARAANDRPDQGGWHAEYVERVGSKLMLKQMYRYEVRRRFYPHDYRRNIKLWMEQNVERRTSPVTGTKEWLYGDEWLPSDVDRHMPTVDHRGQTVAGHWNDRGRMSTPTERADFFNAYNRPSDGELEIVPKSINSSLGATSGERFDPEVTIAFRGGIAD